MVDYLYRIFVRVKALIGQTILDTAHSLIFDSTMAAIPENELLEAVNAGEASDSAVLCRARGWDHDKMYPLISSLANSGFITFEKEQRSRYTMTEEGRECLAKGSPEMQLFAAVASNGGTIDDDGLQVCFVRPQLV